MPMNNPLRMLRSGQFPVVKPRNKTNTLPHSKSLDRRSESDSLDGNRSGKLSSILQKKIT